jgi:HAMP domain-containing protein
VLRPISVKVIGDDFDEIQAATGALEDFMREAGVYSNITQDYRPGNPELLLRHKGDAIKQLGIAPVDVTRALQAYVNGEPVVQFQADGEEVMVRVKAKQPADLDNIDTLLRQTIALPGGGAVALGDLSQTARVTTNDEVRDLVNALDRMTESLRATANIAGEIASGNLAVEARPLSEKDVMGNALARMLEANELGGAGLDVFEHEPSVNPKLLKMDNVVLLPHMGSATIEGRIDMGEKVIINIKTWVDGHNPPDRVLPSML